MPPSLDTYGSADFKAHCLSIIDEVAEKGREVRVTKRGRPAVRIVPDCAAEAKPAYGFLKNTAQWEDDLLSTGEAWDAQGS
jgi:prevent-host-death family protein